MKKRILSLLCALCLLFACAPTAPALEGEARRAADTLITLGLLDEKNYDLSAPVDRLTATTMLVCLSGGVQGSGKSTRLRDVPQAADEAVSYAVRQGWVKAASDTAFGVGQNVMSNDWFTMLLTMLGRNDFTPSEAAVYARRVGLISRAYTGLVTFGDLCESALEVLRFRYPDGDAVIDRLVARELCAPYAVSALGLNRQNLTARQIADRYMSAVFSLALYDTEEAIIAEEVSADASGFFIGADGLAVTNYHSIAGAIQAVATLVTGESFYVERVVWYDVGKDLAVIRVSRTTIDNREISRFATLELAGTTDLRPGDIAYTLSNPLGLGLAVSEGVISATARQVERYELPCVMNTADISQGSSGGALLNVFGRVVAVTSGAYRVGNSMYLAVPVDIFKTLDLSAAGLTLTEVAAKEATQQTQQKPSAPVDEEPEAVRGAS
ncbi:MAG: serine protease [Oscillospiraceae bacterium]|nr:serine protease [Oscillospiraceae bacterium]